MAVTAEERGLAKDAIRGIDSVNEALERLNVSVASAIGRLDAVAKSIDRLAVTVGRPVRVSEIERLAKAIESLPADNGKRNISPPDRNPATVA